MDFGDRDVLCDQYMRFEIPIMILWEKHCEALLGVFIIALSPFILKTLLNIHQARCLAW